MKKHIKYSCFLIVVFTLIISSFAQDDVRLRAVSGGIARINLAVFDILNSSERETGTIGTEMTGVLKNDLKLSGVFTLVPAPQISTIRGLGDSLDYILLDNRGAEYLFRGSFADKGSNIELDVILQHVKSKQSIIDDEKYIINKNNIRWGIHKIADDIVFALTGEPGIAQTKIVFVSERTGNKEIFIMDYDGANIEQLTSNEQINVSPRWSPDGKYIVFSTMNPEPEKMMDINILELSSKKITSLASNKGMDISANWSPDGTLLAYAMSISGNHEIYTSRMDGSGLKQITNNPFIDFSPSFSPSGREIAFISTRSGQPQVYIMNSDGTNIRRLTYYGGYNQLPAWSPKGDKIAFINLDVDSDFDVLTIDVSGENIFQLTDFSGDNEDPSWSPSGLNIAFSSSRGGLPEIYIMNWDGSDQTRITSGGKNTQPNWSPRLKNNFVK